MAGGREKDDAARGWSLVLERFTDEETDEEHSAKKERPPRGEERTVIDPAIAGAVLKELDHERSTRPERKARDPAAAKRGASVLAHEITEAPDPSTDGHPPAKGPARDTDPGESPPPLQFADLTVPSGVGDQTSIDPVPVVQPDLTEIEDRYAAHELDTYDEMLKEPSLPAPVVEKDPTTGSRRAIKETRGQPIRADGPPAGATGADGATGAHGATRAAGAKGAHARGASEKRRNEAEVTVLDLAVRLGLPPEPAAPPPPIPRSGSIPGAARHRADGPPPEREPGRAAGIPPASTRSEAIRTPTSTQAVVLPLPDEGGRPLGAQAVQVTTLLKEEADAAAQRPGIAGYKGREPDLDHLPRWVAVTQNAAKIIPVILGVFVVLATVAASVLMFSGTGSGTTEHVMIRFLPVKVEAGQPEPNPYEPAPSVRIETDPPGLLVIQNSKILGTTPVTVESSVRGERIGVELQSPYFETWIGEATRRESGEIKLDAKLTRKKR